MKLTFGNPTVTVSTKPPGTGARKPAGLGHPGNTGYYGYGDYSNYWHGHFGIPRLSVPAITVHQEEHQTMGKPATLTTQDSPQPDAIEKAIADSEAAELAAAIEKESNAPPEEATPQTPPPAPEPSRPAPPAAPEAPAVNPLELPLNDHIQRLEARLRDLEADVATTARELRRGFRDLKALTR